MSEITNDELDRRTADEIMGWHMNYVQDNFIGWHPSTDLNQAWRVLEEVIHKYHLTIDISNFIDILGYQVELDGDWYECVVDTSISRAICLAALQAGGK